MLQSPDWDYWLSVADVRVREALALSCNVDPRSVRDAENRMLGADVKTLAEYQRRCNIADSHIRAGTLPRILNIDPDYIADVYVKLSDFRVWAEALHKPFVFPKEFPKPPAKTASLAKTVKDAPPAIGSPDEGWETWSKQDLWSHAELAEICIGRIPGTPNRTDSEQIALNHSSEMIARGTHSGNLKFLSRDDADNAARLYWTHRHYVPAVAAEWAAGLFDAFPLVLLEKIRARHAAISADRSTDDDKPLDERERASLHSIIGALAQHQELDLSQPHKAAQAIVAMLPGHLKLSPRTIGEHLKAVRKAMAERDG